MADDVFVDSGWLQDHMDDPHVVVVDVREPYFYGQGHLVDAVNLPAVLLQSAGGEPPPVEALARKLGELGIGRETQVVLYDQGGSTPAGRVYWVLDCIGHPRTWVLDGGITKWRHEGRDIHYVPAVPEHVSYVRTGEHLAALAVLDDVVAAIGDPDSIILDVRTPAEYLGLRETATRDGHIPGAINVDWANAVERDSTGVAALTSREKLRALYETAGVTPDKQVIVMCQAGGRSSFSYAVLRNLGYRDVRNYSAGWQEWGNREDTPVERE